MIEEEVERVVVEIGCNIPTILSATSTLRQQYRTQKAEPMKKVLEPADADSQ